MTKSERLEVWVGRANEATQIIWFCRPGAVLAFDRQRVAPADDLPDPARAGSMVRRPGATQATPGRAARVRGRRKVDPGAMRPRSAHIHADSACRLFANTEPGAGPAWSVPGLGLLIYSWVVTALTSV